MKPKPSMISPGQATKAMSNHPFAMLATAILAVGTAHAAPIYWTVHDIADDVTQVSNQGTTVVAHAGADLGTGDIVDGTTILVNGVTFDDGFIGDSPTHKDTLNSRAGSFSGPNAAYYELLRWADRHNSGNATFTFSGLTVGNTYQIQIWHTDTNGTEAQGMVVNDGGTVNVPARDTPGHATLFRDVVDGTRGQYAIGTFVADDTTQQFLAKAYNNLKTTPAAEANLTINGVQLRDLGVDSSAPSPAPTIATLTPFESRVVVEASTTTTDDSGVEYQFTRRLGLGGAVQHTSAWQDSTTYVDTGLSNTTEYSYTVAARDKHPNQHATAESTEVTVTTLAQDTTPPIPGTMSFAVAPTPVVGAGYHSITMTAVTATDSVYGVEYYFDETSGNPGGDDSGWQDSPTYVDTGLDPNTTYTYTVQARDKADVPNPNTVSAPANGTTDLKGASTITWGASTDITNDVSDISVNGILLDARNGSASTEPTVNGVKFLNIANSGNLMANITNNDNIGNRGYGTVVTDGNYRNLLIFGQRADDNNPGVDNYTTIEFFGLTPGNTYEIQIWASDVAAANPSAQNASTVLGDGSSSAPVRGVDRELIHEVGEGTIGQYSIGTFVATANNQAFNLASYTNLLTSPAIAARHWCNGWQIRDITGVSGNDYASWSGGSAAGDDDNGDGVLNGVAYALGAADPDADARALLPTSVYDDSGSPAYLVFTFNRDDDAAADSTTAIDVEYSTSLGGWTVAENGVNGVVINETGSAPTNVEVKIPTSLAPDGRIFARLNVTVTPP